MILYAGIYRFVDGLPLVGTTDTPSNQQINDCQKYIKTITKKLHHFQDRCLLQLEGFTILFISALGISFLVLCEESYPNVLAFCFLDEVQKEFIVRYNSNQITAVKRPYGFIEYETYLKKMKQRYNSPRTLTTKVKLCDMTTELRLRPPHNVSEYEMVAANGYSNYNSHKHPIPASISGRMVSLDWIAALSMALNVFCALLNLIRGMSIISHGHFDETDSGAYRFGSSFLAATILNFFQIYLLVYNTRLKRQLSFIPLALLSLITFYLHHFRNIYQIMFHMSAATLATGVVIRGKHKDKAPGYNV